VALTGDGWDGAFAGYERDRADGLADRIGSVPLLPGLGARALRMLPAARRERRSPLFRAARLLDAAAQPAYGRYGRLMEVFSPEVIAQVAPQGSRLGASELLPVREGHGIGDLQV